MTRLSRCYREAETAGEITLPKMPTSPRIQPSAADSVAGCPHSCRLPSDSFLAAYGETALGLLRHPLEAVPLRTAIAMVDAIALIMLVDEGAAPSA